MYLAGKSRAQENNVTEKNNVTLHLLYSWRTNLFSSEVPMLCHCPSCLIQTHKVKATLIKSRHKKQVVRFKDKQLSVSHSFTITDKDGFTLTMLHASMMQTLGYLTEKTPILLFLIISSSSFDCTWGPQLMFVHTFGLKQYGSLTEGDAAKAGNVWAKRWEENKNWTSVS